MMKKLRGKKRYYRKLAKHAAEFTLKLGGPDDWYDFWHYHFDWRGQGNKSDRERSEHLRAAFTAFEQVLEQLKAYEEPHQVWLSFAAHNSYQNALYFHTPNPNRDNFPYKFEDYAWSVEVPALLVPYMNEEFEVGVIEFAGDIWYSVRVRETTEQSGVAVGTAPSLSLNKHRKQNDEK